MKFVNFFIISSVFVLIHASQPQNPSIEPMGFVSFPISLDAILYPNQNRIQLINQGKPTYFVQDTSKIPIPPNWNNIGFFWKSTGTSAINYKMDITSSDPSVVSVDKTGLLLAGSLPTTEASWSLPLTCLKDGTAQILIDIISTDYSKVYSPVRVALTKTCGNTVNETDCETTDSHISRPTTFIPPVSIVSYNVDAQYGESPTIQKQRLQEIINKVMNYDIVCLQGVYTATAINYLSENMKGSHPHVESNTGSKKNPVTQDAFSYPSGLFIASKYMIDWCFFEPFTSTAFPDSLSSKGLHGIVVNLGGSEGKLDPNNAENDGDHRLLVVNTDLLSIADSSSIQANERIQLGNFISNATQFLTGFYNASRFAVVSVGGMGTTEDGKSTEIRSDILSGLGSNSAQPVDMFIHTPPHNLENLPFTQPEFGKNCTIAEYTYDGCYMASADGLFDFTIQQTLEDSKMSSRGCFEKCKTAGHTHFALRDKKCYCSSSDQRKYQKVEETGCSLVCPASGEPCGNINYDSVYQILANPEYCIYGSLLHQDKKTSDYGITYNKISGKTLNPINVLKADILQFSNPNYNYFTYGGSTYLNALSTHYALLFEVNMTHVPLPEPIIESSSSSIMESSSSESSIEVSSSEESSSSLIVPQGDEGSDGDGSKAWIWALIGCGCFVVAGGVGYAVYRTMNKPETAEADTAGDSSSKATDVGTGAAVAGAGAAGGAAAGGAAGSSAADKSESKNKEEKYDSDYDTESDGSYDSDSDSAEISEENNDPMIPPEDQKKETKMLSP